MNNFEALINKIKIFSYNTIESYKISKLAQEMTLEDFTDNSVIYNTNTKDHQISLIKKTVNDLLFLVCLDNKLSKALSKHFFPFKYASLYSDSATSYTSSMLVPGIIS